MNKPVLAILLLTAGLLGTAGHAQDEETEPVYRVDPALGLSDPQPPAQAVEPPVVIRQEDERSNLRLQTATPLAPYLGAERAAELSPEETRLLKERKDRGELSDYRLEAGIGLHVEDRASLNLGYRFHQHPSLLEDRRADPLTLSGDLRISFDLKLPFD